MTPPTPEQMRWSAGKIAKASRTWARWNGFSGETCGKCKATANVLGCGPGWFCPCGHYNMQSWNHNQMPHRKPTYGPTTKTIHRAVALATVDEVRDLCAKAGIPVAWVDPCYSYFGTFRTNRGPVHIELDKGSPTVRRGPAKHPQTRAAAMRASFRAIQAAP